MRCKSATRLQLRGVIRCGVEKFYDVSAPNTEGGRGQHPLLWVDT